MACTDVLVTSATVAALTPSGVADMEKEVENTVLASTKSESAVLTLDGPSCCDPDSSQGNL